MYGIADYIGEEIPVPETLAGITVGQDGEIVFTKQDIERQIRNILKSYPKAEIWQEAFTGTKTEGRKKFEQLLKIIRAGDIVVFDSVSRMSRNAEIGFQIYQELYDKGVELVFLKEPHINTAT